MILLDTHVWWWSLSEPENLSKAALKKIKNTKPDQRAIASISIWEFAIMTCRNKIEVKIPPDEWLSYALGKTGLRVFEINPKVAIDVCSLPGDFHKDPADRIIVATARVNNMTLITKDEKILRYPHVNSIW
ncbi:MAG: type II toxin-antitoxin system VapC family toxin [Candidatus Hodarchaeota archaeon]